MATNRRPLKRRRLGPAAEAKAWGSTFESRWDFFGDLNDIGFPPGFDRSADYMAAAEDAWRRLGAIYLANRDPAMCNSARPWASDEFGDP